MRWVLGFVCVATGCFSEPSDANPVTADDTSSAPPTSSATASTSSTTETTSDADPTLDPSDATTSESSGADTTTGDPACAPGTAPIPPVPASWQGPVFVTMPAVEPMGCPDQMSVLAVGYLDLPPTLDECACRCATPYEELCELRYRTGDACPPEGSPTPLDGPCTELPAGVFATQVDGSAMSCDPEPVPPKVDRVLLCAMPPSDEPCADLVAGLRGPCIFRDAELDCPPDLVPVEAGRQANCAPCGLGCDITEHCATPLLAVHGDEMCADQGEAVSLSSCIPSPGGAAAISAAPSLQQTCESTSLILDELTLCCPPI